MELAMLKSREEGTFFLPSSLYLGILNPFWTRSRFPCNGGAPCEARGGTGTRAVIGWATTGADWAMRESEGEFPWFIWPLA